MPISFLKLQNIKPRERDFMIADGDGLYLRVWPSGRKSWLWRKKIDGKFKAQSLGDFPEVSIQEARDRCAKLNSKSSGELLSEAMTFKQVYSLWLNTKKEQIKDWRRIEMRFDKYFSLLYDKPFIDVKPIDIFSLLQVPIKRGRYDTARKAALWVAQLERYALALGVIPYLKFQGLYSTLPKGESSHRPAFPPKELPFYMPRIIKMAQESIITWDLVRTGFFTLLRPGEYAALEWDWIDFDKGIITVPAAVMKMKREHRVPISTQLKALLQNRVRVSRFVFPHRIDKDKHVCLETLPRLFRRHSFTGVLVPHGIRSIGRTWMAEQGFDHAAAELCLAHVVGSDVERAYNRTDLLEKRRPLMQAWCDFVQEAIDEAPIAEQPAR